MARSLPGLSPKPPSAATGSLALSGRVRRLGVSVSCVLWRLIVSTSRAGRGRSEWQAEEGARSDEGARASRGNVAARVQGRTDAIRGGRRDENQARSPGYHTAPQPTTPWGHSATKKKHTEKISPTFRRNRVSITFNSNSQAQSLITTYCG